MSGQAKTKNNYHNSISVYNIQEKIIGWYISATTMLTIVVGYQSGYPSADHWMMTHTIVTIQLINRQFLIPKIVKNASPKLLKRVLRGFALKFVKDCISKILEFLEICFPNRLHCHYCPHPSVGNTTTVDVNNLVSISLLFFK